MSVAKPPTRPIPGGEPAPAAPPAGRGARLAARADALATPRNLVLLLAAGAGLMLLLFFLRATYPNYDSYYTLIWGEELAQGSSPDYDVLRTPTPHPLSTLAAAGLSFLGGAADRALILVSLASFLAVFAALFRLTQMLLGALVAGVAMAVLATRTDLWFFALRGMVDIPFLALVFWAAVLELRRPRRGPVVLVLLALAGLLRPEAWIFAGAYVLWCLAGGLSLRRFLAYAALAAAAPVLWLVADWIVTGEPLYSLTSTREVAGQFKRQRTLLEAAVLIPDYVGGNEKIVNVMAGGLGGLMALWLMRARAALPLALVGIGFFVFLAIAAVGLSVIPRYLVIPSLIFNLCVAVALVGWTLTSSLWGRRLGIGLMALTLLLVAWRTPAYLRDARKLNGQTEYVRDQHRGLKAILDDPEVVPLLRSCRPITMPSHSSIPVVRFETGLPKTAFQASIEQQRPPERGILMLARSFNFEPGAARTITGAPSLSARKWWSNYPLSTFGSVAANESWRVLGRC